MSAKFKHDCDRCEYLGTVRGEHEARDIYLCLCPRSSTEPRGGIVVSRWGDDGSENSTYFEADLKAFLHPHEWMRAALKLLAARTP